MHRVLVIAALLLGACGTDEPSDKGSDGAACTDLVGQTMTRDLDGCEVGGEYIAAIVLECSDRRVLVMVGDASSQQALGGIYGFVGKPIKALEGDGTEYRALLGCRDDL